MIILKPKILDLNFKAYHIQNTGRPILKRHLFIWEIQTEIKVWHLQLSKAAPVSAERIVWVLSLIKENYRWFISQSWISFFALEVYQKFNWFFLFIFSNGENINCNLQSLGKSTAEYRILGMKLTELTASAAKPPFLSFVKRPCWICNTQTES